MRKLVALFTVMALFVVALVPTMAQDEDTSELTIAEIVAAQASAEEPEFTTLLTAVGLADAAVAEALGDPEAELTVFAPTDAAFGELPEEILTAALGDTELLTSVLLYHVLEGTFLAEAVVGLDDGTEVETLNGESVVVTFGEEGEVFVNDAQVVVTDIVAANGVIHVIDTVLLPPSVAGGGEEEMAEEEMAPEETVDIRVAHFAPDAPAVDIYVDGEAALTGLAYPSMTSWTPLPAGTYTFDVVPAGTEEEPTTIDDSILTIEGVELTFNPEERLTFAAVGSLANETFFVQPIVEDYSALGEEEVRVTVFHAIEGAPAVDVLVDGNAVAAFLNYPQTNGNNDGALDFTAPDGIYNLVVAPAGTTEPLLQSPAQVLLGQHNYFFAAIGTLEDPGLFADGTSVSEAAE